MLGDNVKNWMHVRKIGNNELSQVSGVPLTTINNIIYNRTPNPSIRTITAITASLNCSFEQLLEPELRDNQEYVFDRKSATIARDICFNPDLKSIFELVCKADSQDLKLILQVIDRMLRNENGGEK